MPLSIISISNWLSLSHTLDNHMTIAIDCLESRSSFNRRGREESLRNSRRIENIMSTTFVYIVLIAFAANLLSGKCVYIYIILCI